MLRRAIVAFAALCLLAFPAFALTPGQRAALLSGGGTPAWVLQGAGVPATFDLNFATAQYYQTGHGGNLASLLNVSRASAGAAISSTGVWTQFPANAPRITDLGILVEEARTNGIRNNSMQGAKVAPGGATPTHWGTVAAGLTTAVVALGTQNGIDYIDLHVSGTPSGIQYVVSFENGSIIAAVQGQSWTNSLFAALVAGTTTNITTIKANFSENNSGGTFLTQHLSTDFKGSLPATLNTSSRFSATATTSNASCAFVAPSIVLALTVGQAIDITLRLGWPQIELGAFITSPIRTAVDAAVTRAADLVTLANLPAFGSAWSFFINGSVTEVSAVRSLLGTSVANNQPIYSPTSNTLADANNGSVALAATTGSGGWTTGAKAAAGFSAAGRSIVMNNGTVATDANTHIAPTTLYIGATAGTVAGVKTISRVAGWASTRIGDTTLKALTQ